MTSGRECRIIDNVMPTILWKRLDTPGHEHARVTLESSCWRLTGSAVFREEARPARLEYLVVCDEQWRTRAGRVKGWLGDTVVDLSIEADGHGRWQLNGKTAEAVAGCVDLDLSFSPSTNLLPIRRLDLAIGGSAEVRSAWLRFPELTLAPLHQTYHRVDATTYRYESPSHDLRAVLRVNETGFVTHYPNLWEYEADA